MPTYRVVAGLAAAMAMGFPAAAVANTWSGPIRIPGPTGLTVPHAAMDAAGEAVVMWSDGNGHVYASIRSAAGRFSAPQTLVSGPDGTAVRAEQLAVGRDGTAVVVWAQAARRSPHYRVMASVRRPHGRFGPARIVGDGPIGLPLEPQRRGQQPRHDRRSSGRATTRRGSPWPSAEGASAPRARCAAGALSSSSPTRRTTGSTRRSAPCARRAQPAWPPRPALYATSTAAPPRFAAPRRVAVNGLDPALAAGPSRSMTLAWRTGAGDTSESIGMGPIYAARSARGGPFGGPVAVSPVGIDRPRPHRSPAAPAACW